MLTDVSSGEDPISLNLYECVNGEQSQLFDEVAAPADDGVGGGGGGPFN